MITETNKPKLRRLLTLMDATLINAGGIIGSGIFLVPATVALLTGSLSLMLGVWVLGGIISLFGALSIAELGASMPRAGGQYVYLKEAYGPVWGYLYGWSAVAVINTASIAAVAVAISEYLGFFIDFSPGAGKIAAITFILLLSGLNIVSVKSGIWVQNVITFLKIGTILGIIFLGIFMDGGQFKNFLPLLTDRPIAGLVGPLGLAMIAVLWTYDGWISITYIAGEVKNPNRNIPLSLIFCMLLVVPIYLLINTVFIYTLGFEAMSSSVLVAADSAVVFLGQKGAAIVAIIILVSLLGANNCIILTSARINYAMARDGLFFKMAGRVSKKFKSPANALALQAVWSCLLTLTGTFNQLITYVIFASWIFYGMSAGAVIILRKKQPHLHRPYLTPGYPWVTLAFIFFAVLLTINTILAAPRDAAIGMAIILSGLPFYYIQKRASV